MSAYVVLARDALNAFLQRYDIGTILDWRPIRDGIVNSNYDLQTERGAFVLTLFEHQSDAELRPALASMRALADHGLPCPRPLHDRNGRPLGVLHDQPALLAARLPGASLTAPDAAQCRTLGATLAAVHRAAPNPPAQASNPNGLAWQRSIASRLALERDAAELLADELAFQTRQNHAALPKGLVHGDLFRDNVLFDGDRLTGLLDWYDAFVDAWFYDVAVAVNDWCVQADGALDTERYAALLAGYRSVRLPSDDEYAALPALLRAAALRFWLSRLVARTTPRSGHLVLEKDPDEFKRILLQRRNGA